MSDTNTGRGKLIGNLVVITFSFVFTAVFVEIMLHLLPNPLKDKYRATEESTEIQSKPHPVNMYSMLNDYHWRLTPDSSVRFVTSYYDISVNSNSQGIRDIEYSAKDESTFRILGLGDSFAFGWGVSEENSLYKQLQSKLVMAGQFKSAAIRNIEVVNAGIPGFGTYESLEMLKGLGTKYSPNLILLAFYEGNDYLNNKSAPRKREIFQGYLKDVDPKPKSEVHEKLKGISIFYSGIVDVITKVREKTRFKSSIEKTKSYLTEMKQYADTIEAPFYVFIIPDQDPEFYSRSTLMQQYDEIVAGMNLYDARDELLQFGKASGIYIKALSTRFENNSSEISLDKNDSHFNERGHELAASELLLWLKNELVN